MYFIRNFTDIGCNHLFDSVSNDAESSFEVYFTIPGDKAEKTYNYGFCVEIRFFLTYMYFIRNFTDIGCNQQKNHKYGFAMGRMRVGNPIYIMPLDIWRIM